MRGADMIWLFLGPALVAMVVLEVNGDAAFGHTSIKENVLLVSLGVVTAVPLAVLGPVIALNALGADFLR